MKFNVKYNQLVEANQRRRCRMTIPDNIIYTRGEKVAEIACAGTCAAFATAMAAMMSLGQTDGGNSILLVVLLVIYGAFTLCSVFPQHTNIFYNPERISEASFRKARCGFIVAKSILMAAIFVLSLPILQ